MNNKRISRVLTGLMCILSLAGCQKAPDEVVENMKNYGDNSQVSESELVYCTLDELKNSDIKKIKEETGIKIPDDTSFASLEEVDLLKVQFEEDFVNKHIDEYSKLFGVDSGMLSEYPSSVGGGKLYEYFSDDFNIGLNDSGFVSYIVNKEISKSEVTGRYHMETDNTENVMVDFKNGSMKLDDMCSKAEEWYKKYMPGDTLEYVITDAIIRNVKYDGEDDGEEAVKLSVLGEFYYKGMVFNNHFMNIFDEKDEEYTHSVQYSTQTEYDDADNMTWFTINNQTMNVVSAERKDKIVSFESAVKKVCETLSGFRGIEFIRVLPVYEVTVRFVPGIDPSKPGQVLEARPVYVFLTSSEIIQDGGTGIKYDDFYGRFFTVDMITGDTATNIQT